MNDNIPNTAPVTPLVPKRTLREVLEELCPGVYQRNRPAWANPTEKES